LPTAEVNIEAFNGGELSPRVKGRLALPNYQAGSAIIENLIPLKGGALERRPGTEYVTNATGAEGSDSTLFTSEGSWLVPFRIATGASYQLELSDYKMRFFRGEGQLLHSFPLFSESQVNPTANQFEIDGHGFRHGQQVTFHVNPGGTAPAGLTDGATYTVCLPEAMRSIDPTGGSGLYEAEGTETFDVNAEMGPYIARHEDLNGSPGERHVWIHTTALTTTACRVSLTKGGSVFSDGTSHGSGWNALVPTLDSKVNTFRLSTDYGTQGKNFIRTAVVTFTDTGTGGGWFEAAGDPPVEIDTPWSYEEAKRLQYTSDADVMLFYSPDGHPPHELLRFGTSSFVLQPIVFTGGPLGPEAPLGGRTKVLLAIPAPEDQSQAATITCDVDFFRGSDVGLPFRRTRDGTQEGLKHTDLVITRFDAGSSSFWVEAAATTSSAATGIMTMPAGHGLLHQEAVWVWPKDDASYDFPPELSARQLYYLTDNGLGANEFQLSLTIGTTAAGGTPLVFSAETGGMRIVSAELRTADLDNVANTPVHGWADGTAWAGVYSEGTLPGGIVTGQAYKIRTVLAWDGTEDDDRFFLEHMDGSTVPILDEGSGKHVCSAALNTVAVVKGKLIRAVTNNAEWETKNEKWRIGQWGAYRGWPGACTIRGERLVVGGSDAHPMNVWGSELAVIRSFIPDTRTGSGDDTGDPDRTITEASSWSYLIESESTERITWLHASTVVIAGTVGPLFTVEGLTPNTVTATLMTSRGASNVRPVVSDAQLIWGSSKHHHIFAAGFQEARGALVPDDITKLADHLFTKTNHLVQLAIQEEPWSLLWAARQDGMLLSCTYDLEQGVQAWARHPIGGSHSFSAFNYKTHLDEVTVRDHAAVKSIGTIPSEDGTETVVWMVVERLNPLSTTPNQIFRTIERMTVRFELDTPKEDAYFVDCGVAALDVETADTPLASIVTHDVLFDRECDLWIDGARQAKTTASSAGVLTFPDAAVYKVVVGIPYVWKWRSLSIEALLQVLPSLKGVQGEITQAQIDFINSLGGKISRPGGPKQTFDFRTRHDVMDAGPELFSGTHEVNPFPGNPSKTQEIEMEGDGPEPAQWTNIIVTLYTGKATA